MSAGRQVLGAQKTAADGREASFCLILNLYLFYHALGSPQNSRSPAHLSIHLSVHQSLPEASSVPCASPGLPVPLGLVSAFPWSRLTASHPRPALRGLPHPLPRVASAPWRQGTLEINRRERDLPKESRTCRYLSANCSPEPQSHAAPSEKGRR